jgi:SAM-dependent methyltransferase
MEDAASSIVAHYERHARGWDADRRAGGWGDKTYIERFRSFLPAGASVLDLGCGGGDPVALHMTASGFRVTGVDSSPTLLSLCRERMPEQEWIVTDMRSLALGRQFDGMLAWDSFFHLSPGDQRMMFGVFATHAHACSFLMFNAGPSEGEAVGAYRGDPLYHASLDPSEYETLLAGAGFELIEHSVGDFAKGGRSYWLARAIEPQDRCA